MKNISWWLERFLNCIQALFPLLALVISPTAQDPVRGIALPAGEPPRDASAISAYYLSFYE
jgi:hypothetical protein